MARGVPGGRAGRTGPLGDEDRGVGGQRGDVAEQEAGEVGTVRGEVAQHAAAAALPLVPPGQRALRMRRVVAEQADAHMCHGADLAGRDEVASGLDGGGVAVVEADGAVHAGPGGRVGHGPGVRGGQPDRLLDPEVLAGLGHRHTDLPVQEVRRGDADRLDARVGGHLAPVPGRRGEPEACGGLLGAARHLLGDRDQLRAQRQVRVVVREAGVRLCVHAPHPAESDDGDAERVHHCSPSLDRSIFCPGHHGSPR
ncbi:hypothetical protein RKD41_006151 [Streptomyces tendae]